jgi:YidC/Oxa1 family membrane protein insertase
MTDIRRSLLWGIFLVSLVMLWDAWNKHQGMPSMFGSAPQVAMSPAATDGAAVPSAGGTSSVPSVPSVAVPQAQVPGAAGVAAPAAAPTAVPVPGSETVTITTDVYKATLDSRGGTMVRLELLKQHEQVARAWYEAWLELFTGAREPKQQAPNVVLFDQSAQRTYLARSGLAKVGSTVYPNHESLMKLAPGDRSLADGQNELVVRFESDTAGGLQLVKTYTFRRGDYTVDVRHDIVNQGSEPVKPYLYTELVRDGNPPPGSSSLYFTFTGPAVYTEAKAFQKVDFSAIEKRGPKDDPGHVAGANDGWIAMIQHYFASAWLVPAGQERQFSTAKVGNNLYSVAMMMPLENVAGGATRSFDARLFVGPQEEKRLAQLARGLDLVKDYGWFRVLAQPLFWLLDKLYSIIGNWGWSIVALVVLLKIAFYWLNASAYRSMAKMKAVNPRVMELRERHKDNPQQMQQEMMRLYREEKVNPLGGCLPIVAQMPFFIALYWVLLSSVETRNAPWIGWIHDLSAIDPYYILPLLMTGSTMFQTWLNPTPPDPMQARMMWIMPLVFSVMFFFFPAGLVLYWLTNNILSIAQQWFINRQLGVSKLSLGSK